MNVTIKKLDIKKDTRGWLAEILRPEDIDKQTFGQILVTVASTQETKGNHYHTRKTEWYCVVKGEGLVTIIDRKTKEKQQFTLGETNMAVLTIPPQHVHAIKNIGSGDMYLLIYVDEPFNPADPDTFEDME